MKWFANLKKAGDMQLISQHVYDVPPMEIMEMGRSGFSPTTNFYFYYRRWVPRWLATFVTRCFLVSTVQYVFSGYPGTSNALITPESLAAGEQAGGAKL